MKLKLATALLALTVLVSCKKDEKTAPETPKIQNDFFSVDVETSAKKTDSYALYYTEDGTNDFKDVNAVWAGVKGGQMQTIQFKLSEEIIPTHIRLDLGLKQDQDSVVVKNVKVNYYDNVFEFRGSDFFNYFQKNEQFSATVDPANGTLLVVQKDGVYKTPYFYPTSLMIESIKKITTAKK
jgi:hypothetical protein